MRRSIQERIGLKVETPFKTISKTNGIVVTGEAWFDSLAIDYPIYSLKRIFQSSDSEMKKYYRLKFESTLVPDSVAEAFNNQPEVAQAWVLESGKFNSTPNDTYYGLQWALDNIQAEDAWDIESGDSTIIIAIIDSGFDLGHPDSTEDTPHPDLLDNLWNGNGLYGYRVQDNEELPRDELGHGTHVAGIAGAITNNGTGVSGLAGGGFNSEDGVTIMIVKFDENNVKDEGDAAAGIEWAADNGADIINMSFSFQKTYQWCYYNPESGCPYIVLQEAINYANSLGCVLVASVTNSNTQYDDNLCEMPYPAGFNSVIAVTSVDSNDVKAPSADYAEWVDVSAPGGFGGSAVDTDDIYSTTARYFTTYESFVPGWTRTYGYFSGCSMATPYVSGLAGLILSLAPDADHEMVRSIIKATADDIDQLNPSYSGELGSGRINAYEALALISTVPSAPGGLIVVNFRETGEYPNLIWSESDIDVISYNVYSSQSSAGPYILRANVEDNEWTDVSYEIQRGGNPIYYRVKAKDVLDQFSAYSNTASVFAYAAKQAHNAPQDGSLTPDEFSIGCYPNPFNPTTTIRYGLPEMSDVNLVIYDIRGIVVRSWQVADQNAGWHDLTWGGTNEYGRPIYSGIYFTRLQSGSYTETIKVLYLK